MSVLASLQSSGWKASPLSSQWNGAAKSSPMSSQWKPVGLLSAAADSAIAAGNAVSGKTNAGSDVAPIAASSPVAGQTSPLTTKPVTDQSVQAMPVTTPAVKWSKDAPVPKTADGRDYLVWGNSSKSYIDPDAAERVYSQLKAQKDAMPAEAWRSGEKGKQVSDDILRDMAHSLVASGVSDISEVGKTTVLTKPGEKGIVGDKFFSGSSEVVKKLDDGRMVIERPETEADEGGERQTGRMKQVELSQEEVAKVIEQDGQLILPVYKDRIINKRTGQPVSGQQAKPAQAGAAPTITADQTGKAAFDALPKGARYIGPDGRTYSKN